MRARALPALIALPLLLAGCAGGVRGPWDKDAPVVPLQVKEKKKTPPRPKLKRYVQLLANEDGTVGAIEVKTPSARRVLSRVNEVFDFDDPAQRAQPVAPEAFRANDEVLPAPEGRFVLYFESDSAELTAPSREWLPEILATLAKRPAPDIRIIGHADRSGDDGYNDKLSLERAGAVRKALLDGGIEPASLEIEGRGEREPSVATEDGVREPKNRRVEIVVW